MPIYEYRCTECAQVFEEWQKDFQEREAPCPVCGSKAERLISSTSFVLKGSGWYVTDYCRSGPSGTQCQTDKAGAASGAESQAGSGQDKVAATETSPAKDAGPACPAPAPTTAG